MASQSDHSDAGSVDVGIELGFVKRLDKEEFWRLHRCYFPSKVGGKPAWLDPKDLPSSDDLKCDGCGKPTVFLLQVYAPNDDNDSAFHRSIYIFCCKTEECYEYNSSLPFKVFRCQLKRENEYYALNPPDYESPTYFKSCKEFSKLCHICGCAGSKLCSRCQKVSYCCKHHQALHWRIHKILCGKDDSELFSQHQRETSSDLLFPEYEVVMENEETMNDVYENPLSDRNTEVLNGSFSPSELEQFANLGQTDKQFSIFRKTIANSSDQVLRYDKAGSPLWCASENKITAASVPKCGCGAFRQFEFQVMPQLLNHLSVRSSIDGPSIDWGTLVVYTCTQDCEGDGRSYVREFLHKQDFTHSTTQ